MSPVHSSRPISGFPTTGLQQVLRVYGELTRKPVQIEPGLAAPPLTFKSQTPLTTGEVIYALDFLLAWHGLAVVPQPDGTTKLSRLVASESKAP